MKTLLLSSAVLIFVLGLVLIPSASALPVSYNTTAINLGLTSITRPAYGYDIFVKVPDSFLWAKFDNNTVNSSPLNLTSSVTYNSNLKAMYHFESTITDDTTNGNGLTVTGSSTFVNGHEGKGWQSNGASYLSKSSFSGLPTGATARSISFWVYPTSFVNSDVFFFYGSTGGTDQAFFMQYSGTSGNLLVSLFSDDLTSTSTLTLNQWNHVVVTLTGTSLQLWINGASAGSKTTGTPNTASSTFYVGASSSGTQILPSGTILDEFRVYNGVALSQAQVLALDEQGHYSQSHTFDGGEYVSYGSSASPSGNQDRTFSTWIYPTSFVNGIVIYASGTTSTDQAFNLQYSGTSGNVLATLFSDDLTSTSTLTVNTWNYVAVTLHGTTLTIYINGASAGSKTTGTPNTASSSVFIGASSAGGSQFTGQLDNFKIYPYALSASQITQDYNSVIPNAIDSKYYTYYTGASGSSILTKQLGLGSSTINLACVLNSNSQVSVIPLTSNGTSIYYACGSGSQVYYTGVGGTNHNLYHVTTSSHQAIYAIFPSQNAITTFSLTNPASVNTPIQTTISGGNLTIGSGFTLNSSQSNQAITTGHGQMKYNTNGTGLAVTVNTLCDINYNPTNATTPMNAIACDVSTPAMLLKYWDGLAIQKIAGIPTNSTQYLLNSIDSNTYKKLLTLPCYILTGSNVQCIDFIMKDANGVDNIVVVTSTKVYYGVASTALTLLNNNNYASQSYDIITQFTPSSFGIQNPLLQTITLYGFNVNTTLSQTGMMTLTSGYNTKTTGLVSPVRTIDPRWTNDVTDIPIITSTGSLFPIYLTVSNAPVFSAIKVTSATQLINNQESVWAVSQLDSTRTVEFDMPPGVCSNIYVADISVSPTIWNFQGIICATGVNQKTISYTNTLPFTFWTYPWGASDSFTPNTNGLVTTVRHTTAPFSYNIVLKNSTGVIFQNTTYTSNSTLDTQNFNLTGKAKPVSLYISSVTGGVNQIYSAFLGSPISLANTASFFNQYFSYQGFNLLAFIPIIFASMFTRNTIGIGVILTVLCIATLSWLSVVVIPELDIMVMIVIAIIGLIAYRLTYY